MSWPLRPEPVIIEPMDKKIGINPPGPTINRNAFTNVNHGAWAGFTNHSERQQKVLAKSSKFALTIWVAIRQVVLAGGYATTYSGDNDGLGQTS